jgi:hypothetical protein
MVKAGASANAAGLGRDGASGPSYRRAAVAIAVVAALATAVALWLAFGRGGGTEPAPLVAELDGEVALGLPTDVGEAVTTGLVELINHGRRPVVLRHVALAHASGIRLVGALAYPRQSSTPIGALSGFPVPPGLPARLTPHGGKPIAGYVVQPGDRRAVRIMLGITPTRPGKGRFRGVVVTYEADQKKHRVVYPLSFRLCAPKKAYWSRRSHC